MNIVKKVTQVTPATDKELRRPKKPCHLSYVTPTLICYGDVRDITLGGSINPGDPGVPGSTRRNF